MNTNESNTFVCPHCSYRNDIDPNAGIAQHCMICGGRVWIDEDGVMAWEH